MDTGSLEEAGEGGRTLDIHVGNETNPHAQEIYAKRLTISSDTARSAGAADCPDAVNDADLETIVHSWPTLSFVVKAGILAMIRAATQKPNTAPSAEFATED